MKYLLLALPLLVACEERKKNYDLTPQGYMVILYEWQGDKEEAYADLDYRIAQWKVQRAGEYGSKVDDVPARVLFYGRYVEKIPTEYSPTGYASGVTVYGASQDQVHLAWFGSSDGYGFPAASHELDHLLGIHH